MIKMKVSGDYKDTIRYLKRSKRFNFKEFLHYCGRMGVAALKSATPEDTGKTANSWNYKIKLKKRRTTIYWTNSNVVDGYCVALLLQYGHGTSSGTYVEGYDYINPAVKPIFDNILFELINWYDKIVNN